MSKIEQLLTLNDNEHANALIKALLMEGKQQQKAEWASHMTPSIEEPSLLGQLLAGLHNGNLLSPELYPQLQQIEQELITWFCQLFGQQAGHFTHGSSYASLEALWQARDTSHSLSKHVYGSKDVHYSVPKACQILGLEFQVINTDHQGRMDAGALKQACQHHAPLAIIITAGATSSGAIDPIRDCIAIAQHYHAWSHIDAAWGGALILLEDNPHLAGIEQADSLCFDPHKAWGQPKPCSILLYQQPLDSLDNIDYLAQSPKKSLIGSYGGELFLPLWLSLLHDPNRLLSQLHCRLEQARIFYLTLKKSTDWHVNYSPTGIVCFETSADLSTLEEQGILSHAMLNNSAVYRVVFSNDQTTSQALLSILDAYF